MNADVVSTAICPRIITDRIEETTLLLADQEAEIVLLTDLVLEIDHPKIENTRRRGGKFGEMWVGKRRRRGRINQRR